MIQNSTLPDLQAVVHCARHCEHCSAMCITENRPHCAAVARDCAAVCWLTSSFIARDATAVLEVIGLCADICETCATECEQHDNDHCRACAEACRACAKECRQMSETTPRTPKGESL